MTIGLKGSWKELKGGSLTYKLSSLKRNLRYAWQRAWRGYDDVDVFSMRDNFIERYTAILKDYRENHICLFNVPDEYRDKVDRDHLTEEETDAIIDKMIYHLEMMDENHAQKVLYGTNIFDDDYDPSKFTSKDYEHIFNVMDANKHEFMELFSDFFWQLWD